MAKGRDKHQANVAAVAALGRNLSRRARNRCELCETSTSLKVVEVAGSPEEEPTEEWALMLCERCEEAIGPKSQVDPNTLRFLETTMWSEVQPVQLTAVRLLRSLEAAWAQQALEGLYLDPEVEALV